jgi:hypothetical protein
MKLNMMKNIFGIDRNVTPLQGSHIKGFAHPGRCPGLICIALTGHNRAMNICAPDWLLHFNPKATSLGKENADNIEFCGKFYMASPERPLHISTGQRPGTGKTVKIRFSHSFNK